MTEETQLKKQWLANDADTLYAYLTTTGRRTGQPHRIEIWFGVDDGRMYLMSGGRDRADWVRNIRVNAHVTVELGDEAHAGTARIIRPDTDEDRRARELLVAKYKDGDLDEWGRTALPVVIEFATSPQS